MRPIARVALGGRRDPPDRSRRVAAAEHRDRTAAAAAGDPRTYVIPGALAASSGIIIAFYTNSVSPASHGNFYELYAIAACVGGCSLRGGEGSVLGIVLGAALLQVCAISSTCWTFPAPWTSR